MNNIIPDLFNDASSKLVEAMKLYVELIGVNLSIKKIDIDILLNKRLAEINSNDSYTIVSDMEQVSKNIDKRVLEKKQESIVSQIIQCVTHSIMKSLILLSTSISEKNDYGVQMSRIMIESNCKFINNNKNNITISILSLIPEITQVESSVLKSSYKNNLMLINTLKQLKSLSL